jgi:hypothetical protein
MPPKKRGCWFYGCLTLAILVVVGGIATWFSVRYFLRSAGGLLDHYTSTNPVPIESVSVAPVELKSLQDRVGSFMQGLDGQKGSRELKLTAHDINALIQNDPQYKDTKGRLFVMIDDDQIKAKISMPLDDLGPFKLKGRFLNGTAAVTVALENGLLEVRLKDVQVGGNSLPGPIISELKKMNFAEDYQKNPDASRAIDKLESIQVKDGTLILRAKEPPK